MTISLKHSFTSPVTDAGDPEEVGPDEWNAEHTLTQATGKLLGRSTAGSGATEEIAPSARFSLAAGGLDLASIISAGGPVGSATVAPIITYDAYGRLTAVSQATITPAASSITDAGDLTKTDDTNVTLTLGGTATGSLLKSVTLTLGWTGTLAAARLNSNVVQAVTNDTNITGSIATQTLTFAWSGHLAMSRGGFGQSVAASSGFPLFASGSLSFVAPATGIATWLATPSSANLASAITDETGTGSLVFANAPALTSPTVTTQSARDNSTKAASTAYVDTATREKLTAARTYYVRTDGSDSNTGLANTSGGAFLTLQKAIDVVSALDLSIYVVTISVADGTYTAGVSVTTRWSAGAVILQGNTTTPANCVISLSSGNCVAVTGANLTIVGFKLVTSSGIGLYASTFASIVISGKMEYGACSTAQLYADRHALIATVSDYTISGNAAAHMTATGYGYIYNAVNTITLTGTPAFTTFANSIRGGTIDAILNTFSGSATGSRYTVENLSLIYTAGAGTSYFPGNAAGTGTNPGTSPYGLYA